MDDKECILKSAQEAIPIFAAGIPEIGVRELDPIFFKKIDGSTTNLRLILNDVQLKDDTTFEVVCVLNERTKDEKKYLKIKSCTHTYEFKPDAKMHFDNLFPHNKVLAQAAREIIESNPDLIVSELGPAIVKTIIEAIVKNIGNLAENVPLEDLVILD
ncbi:unnamed protein product, partial [Iphiclides podalirius]